MFSRISSSSQVALAREPLESDVPPAVACAHCGQAQCEGCRPTETSTQRPGQLETDFAADGTLPWEGSHPAGYIRRLVLTARATAHPDQACFKRRGSGSFGSAVHFALVAETLAICSFAVPWILGFSLVFPELALSIAQSSEVLLFGVLILMILVIGVVVLHMVWGGALEWALARRGVVPEYGMGQRFGLYACGWDLLTSPAGVALLWLHGGLEAVLTGLSQGARAPRRALFAYLNEGRRVDPKLHRSVLAIGLGISGVLLLAALVSVPAYLMWQWF